MGQPWTPQQHRKFRATMKRKRIEEARQEREMRKAAKNHTGSALAALKPGESIDIPTLTPHFEPTNSPERQAKIIAHLIVEVAKII